MSIRAFYRSMMKPLVKGLDNRYESDLRSRLKVHGFSIFCPTCIGGVIYHRLGEQFCSPTINLWIGRKDFIKFVLNLEYYINENVCFSRIAEGGYPVGKLDDIEVHFNHHKDFDIAVGDWERRKERINWDKIFVIAYDSEDITREDIESLKRINVRNKIVLSSKNYDIGYVKTIKPNLNRVNGNSYLDKDMLLRCTFEKKWDYVSFLNCEKL